MSIVYAQAKWVSHENKTHIKAQMNKKKQRATMKTAMIIRKA